jgi:hypothetical protein
MVNELKGMQEEVVVGGNLRQYTRIFMEGLRKTKKDFIQCRRFRSQNFNLALREGMVCTRHKYRTKFATLSLGKITPY